MNLQEAKAYVGTYAKYNNGSLKGGWLTLSDYVDKEEFLEACRELHGDEEDPELMFQDWEGVPDSLISESYIADEFWELAEEVERRSIDEDALEAWLDYTCREIENVWELLNVFEQDYCGKWESEKAFAEWYFDEHELPRIPDDLQCYIDYESYSIDLFTNYYAYWKGYVFGCF